MLDSTKSFKKLVTDASQLEGIPPSAMSLFAQQAKSEGYEDATAEQGPWLLTLVSNLHMFEVLNVCNSQSLSSITIICEGHVFAI